MCVCEGRGSERARQIGVNSMRTGKVVFLFACLCVRSVCVFTEGNAALCHAFLHVQGASDELVTG